MTIQAALRSVGRKAAGVDKALDARNDAIVAARKAGASFREIAEAAGLTHETVRRIVNGY